jgi:hypothetical protein
MEPLVRLPDELLRGISQSPERRIAAHRANLEAEPADQRTWIAQQDGRAVGFAITGLLDLPLRTSE